jgi:hypothetical protein
MIKRRINVIVAVTWLDVKYKTCLALRLHANRRARGSSCPIYEQHLLRFNSFELATSI